jgi:hypothetical protein
VPPPEPKLAVTVLSVTRISEVRVSRTIFDYTFRIEVKNDGDAFNGVVAELVQVGAGSTIVQGRVPVGDLAAAALASPAQTVTVRHDRARPFDLSAWRWAFSGQAASPPIVPGGLVLGSLSGPVLQGSLLQRRIEVLPSDTRNTVTAIGVTNSTPGGTAPEVTSEGVISWTPGEADFATRWLLLTVQFADGSELVEQLPVRVVRARSVATIPVTGTGTYSDTLGRYVVEVLPSATPLPAGSTMTIRELYDVLGRFDQEIQTGQPGFAVRLLRSPQQPANPSLAVPAASARAPSLKARLFGAGAAGVTSTGLPVEPESDASNPDLPYGNFLVRGQKLSLDDGGTLLFTTRTDVNKAVLDWQPYPEATVAKIQSNCTTQPGAASAVVCSALPGTPVILINGYTLPLLPDSDEDRIGGGQGTWGGLATELTRRGHPVFELRWNTNMRFEEAAGLLWRLVHSVAEGTGRKPFVIGHSFGGVVAHVMAAGYGMEWSPASGQWLLKAAPTTLLEGVATLDSPLSGINSDIGTPLVIGQQDIDALQYALKVACWQVVCVQGGLDPGSNSQLERMPELVAKLGALPVFEQSVGFQPILAAGETITRLKRAWDDQRSSLNIVGARLLTVVGMRTLPKDFASFEVNEAYKLGDGLISLAGQAVRPLDFMGLELQNWGAPNAYPLQSWLSSLPGFSPSFYASVNAVPAQGAAAWMVQARSNGRTYYFARRAAHTSLQASTTKPVKCSAGDLSYDLKPFPIAAYGEDVVVDLRGSCIPVTAKHPLRQVMDTHLKQTNPSLADPPAVSLTLSGRVLLANGQLANAVYMNRTVVDRDGRQIGAANWTRVFDGAYSFDAAQLIRLAVGGDVPDYAEYQVRIEVGDGVDFLPEMLTAGAWGNVSVSIVLPTLTLRPVNTRPVTFTGTVRDANDAAVPQAVVRLARGVNLPYAEVVALPASNTAHLLRSNEAGQLTAPASPGLLPGEYTAWVSSPDHLTKGFARVVVAQGSNIVLDGLQILPEGFTLVSDWKSATTGPAPGIGKFLAKTIVTESGLFGLAWLERHQSQTPAPTELMARFFSPSGNPVTPIQKISTLAEVDYNSIRFVALPNGEAILVWSEYNYQSEAASINIKIKFQRFDAAGSASGSQTTVNERPIFSDFTSNPPLLSFLDDSSFAIVWDMSIYLSGELIDCGVYARFYSSTGSALDNGSPRTLFRGGDGLCAGLLGAAGHSGNRHAVAISEYRNGSSWPISLGSRVFSLSSIGDVLGVAVNALSDSAANTELSDVKIDARPGGGFAVAWATEVRTPTTIISTIYFQIFGADAGEIGARKTMYSASDILLSEFVDEERFINPKAALIRFPNGWSVVWNAFNTTSSLYFAEVSFEGQIVNPAHSIERGAAWCSWAHAVLIDSDKVFIECPYDLPSARQIFSNSGVPLSRRSSTGVGEYPVRSGNNILAVRYLRDPANGPNTVDVLISITSIN